MRKIDIITEMPIAWAGDWSGNSTFKTIPEKSLADNWIIADKTTFLNDSYIVIKSKYDHIICFALVKLLDAPDTDDSNPSQEYVMLFNIDMTPVKNLMFRKRDKFKGIAM